MPVVLQIASLCKHGRAYSPMPHDGVPPLLSGALPNCDTAQEQCHTPPSARSSGAEFRSSELGGRNTYLLCSVAPLGLGSVAGWLFPRDLRPWLLTLDPFGAVGGVFLAACPPGGAAVMVVCGRGGSDGGVWPAAAGS